MNASRLAAGVLAVPPRLHEELDEAIERLSQRLMRNGGNPHQNGHSSATVSPDTARLQESLRFLGQVASGWHELPDGVLPDAGAGYGSTVVVEDVDRGGVESLTLMTGALVDIDRGQVSLASPIGRALLGTAPGVVVTVDTPQRQRRLRVISVCTLRDRIRQEA
ncbi:MAG TPA: GreA/GreB family elongation factor [Longimicrobiales bacterium]|nr:GreA/GreB family elongation factor [Longimicrobiales bacterium]